MERRVLPALSLAIQLVLGFFFGHLYDMRIFMATGALVAAGQNPYAPQDLSRLFHSNLFQGITTTGYPPPWALVLGLVYLLVRPLSSDLLVYNLAIKIPIIAANFGLAALVPDILERLGADERSRRSAWLFLLFNPFVLFASAAWGQFDALVALLALLALERLSSGRLTLSALLLALAIAFKPTAFPLALAAFLFLREKGWRKRVAYFGVLLVASLLLWVGPFLLFHWSPAPILHGWSAQFSVAGGISCLTFFELLRDSYQLSGDMWLVGLVWQPALLLAAFLMRRQADGLVGLLKTGLALTLVFFLTRAWLSEPNILLIVPLVLTLALLGEVDRWALTAVWLVPLVFAVFNTSPIQLLFPSLPGLMARLLQASDVHRTARLVLRTLTVLPWLAAGGWIVVRCARRSTAGRQESAAWR